ncbi:MAG: hypothetical protein Q7U74_09505, partial [Saprospiraceae bacterium]|nr:hypothetical protein [Saprospiraceae bacterium]
VWDDAKKMYVEKEKLFEGFSLELVVEKAQASGVTLTLGQARGLFAAVLRNMFFETTDDPAQSRLSAFVRRSGLMDVLGDDTPGFGAMYNNVGGRWTGDLHMMAFLAYYNLDAAYYWQIRHGGITQVREGNHAANKLGNMIVDKGITDIAYVVPKHLFWEGKSQEQNTNESIWQKGFVNLIAISEENWEAQKKYYKDKSKTLVINLSTRVIAENDYNVYNVAVPAFKGLSRQQIANAYAELFTLFYGMTETIGDRLIARALQKEGYSVDNVDLNDADNPATQIVAANLYLLQPFVELGKKFLDNKLKKLQEQEAKHPGAIDAALVEIKEKARAQELRAHIPGFPEVQYAATETELREALRKA